MRPYTSSIGKCLATTTLAWPKRSLCAAKSGSNSRAAARSGRLHQYPPSPSLRLKRSSVEVADGVRQLITNQEDIFNQGFSARCSWCWRAATPQGLRLRNHRHPGEVFVEVEGRKDKSATTSEPC